MNQFCVLADLSSASALYTDNILLVSKRSWVGVLCLPFHSQLASTWHCSYPCHRAPFKRYLSIKPANVAGKSSSCPPF